MMRRTVLILALVMALAVMVFAPAAGANKQKKPETVQCVTNELCVGTNGANQMEGTNESDQIYGGNSKDYNYGYDGDDVYFFTKGWGADVVADSAGSDGVVLNKLTSNTKVNLTSGDGPEIATGKKKKMSTVNWSGSEIEWVFAGSGNDTIKGNSSNNLLADAGGNDIYAGFDEESGVDVMWDSVEGFADAPSTDDTLDLTNYNLSNVTGWVAADIDQDPSGLVDLLLIVFNDQKAIGIYKYFDSTGTTAAESGPGGGLIETIAFADDEVDFAQAQSIAQTAPEEGQDASVQSLVESGEESISRDTLAEPLDVDLTQLQRTAAGNEGVSTSGVSTDVSAQAEQQLVYSGPATMTVQIPNVYGQIVATPTYRTNVQVILASPRAGENNPFFFSIQPVPTVNSYGETSLISSFSPFPTVRFQYWTIQLYNDGVYRGSLTNNFGAQAHSQNLMTVPYEIFPGFWMGYTLAMDEGTQMATAFNESRFLAQVEGNTTDQAHQFVLSIDADRTG